MRRLLLAALMSGAFGVAHAACYPPPGLGPQQWYAQCGPDMEDGFARGMGGTMTHDQFLQMMYTMYRSAGLGQGGAPGVRQPQPIGPQQCALGAAQCFNGWWRRCERRGVADLWITSAQRC